jgi:tetratricopeptide (TPR) repeat protein
VLNDFDLPASDLCGSEPSTALSPMSSTPSPGASAANCVDGPRLFDHVWTASGSLAGHASEAAIVEFRQLRQLALQRDDAPLTEVACHNLAVAYRQLGDIHQAVCWQQQSLAWRSRRAECQRQASDDELTRLACDLTGRGGDEFLRGDFDLAEALWLRALAIEVWIGSWDGQAIDCGNLGLLAAARGDFAAGVRWLRKSLRFHRLMLDNIGAGTDWLNLAEVFRLQGEFNVSTRSLRRAVRCFERSKATALLERARLRLREALRTEAVLTFDPQLN